MVTKTHELNLNYQRQVRAIRNKWYWAWAALIFFRLRISHAPHNNVKLEKKIESDGILSIAPFASEKSTEQGQNKANNLALTQYEYKGTHVPDAEFVDELDDSARGAIYRIAKILLGGVVAWVAFKAIYLYVKYPSIQDWLIAYLDTKDKTSFKPFPITWRDFFSGSYSSTTPLLLVIAIITVVAALSIAIVISPLHKIEYDSSFIALYTWSRAAIYTGIVLAAVATSIASSQIFGLIEVLTRNIAVADWVVALSLLSLVVAIGTVALASTVASWQSAQTIALLRRAAALENLLKQSKSLQFSRYRYPAIHTTWRLLVLFAIGGIVSFLILFATTAIVYFVGALPSRGGGKDESEINTTVIALIAGFFFFGLTTLWAAMFVIKYRIGKRTPLMQENVPMFFNSIGAILLLFWAGNIFSNFFISILTLSGSLLVAHLYVRGIKKDPKGLVPRRVEMHMWRFAQKYVQRSQKVRKL